MKLIRFGRLGQERPGIIDSAGKRRDCAAFAVDYDRTFLDADGLAKFGRHEKPLLRAKLGLNDADLAVMFVGKLIARKRPADLLGALERLARSATQPVGTSIAAAHCTRRISR